MIIKPNTLKINELDCFLAKIESTETELNNMKIRLKNYPFEIASKIEDKNKLNIARYLYWKIPEISAESINLAFFQIKQKEFLNLMKVSNKKYRCSVCKQPVIFKSRTSLNEYLSDKKRYSTYTCKSCSEKQQLNRQNRWKIKEQEIKDELQKLKNLPYSEYLQTEHWQHVRQNHLKKSKYACQLCNSKNVILHVHHRTYENLGEERWNDLLTLCENCHKNFHKSLKDKDI